MLDTEFVEAADGYPSLPVVGGKLSVSARGLKGYSVFITCDPFASKVTGVDVTVDSHEGDVVLKGSSYCNVRGVTKNLSVIGCDNTDVTDLNRQTLYADSLTDIRSGAIKYNTVISGIYESFLPSVISTGTQGTINYVSQSGVITRDGNTVTINGFVQWSSATGYTGSIRITGFNYSAVSPTAVTISEYGGLTNTNGLTAKIDQLSSNIVLIYDGGNQQTVPESGYIGFSATYETD